MFGKDDSKSKEVKTKEEVKQPEKSSEKPKGFTQREAVYLRVNELLTEQKITIIPGKLVRDLLTQEQHNTLVERVMSDFKTGKTTFLDTPQNKDKLHDDEKLKKYVIGLCSNWLRKDPRLNGTNS